MCQMECDNNFYIIFHFLDFLDERRQRFSFVIYLFFSFLIFVSFHFEMDASPDILHSNGTKWQIMRQNLKVFHFGDTYQINPSRETIRSHWKLAALAALATHAIADKLFTWKVNKSKNSQFLCGSELKDHNGKCFECFV